MRCIKANHRRPKQGSDLYFSSYTLRTTPAYYYPLYTHYRLNFSLLLVGDAENEVGQYNGLTESLDLNSAEHMIRWRDGRGPPKDRTLLRFENSHVNFGLYFTLVVFSIIGIITATVFLIINIKYRNQR